MVNIQNINDNECFKWYLVRYLHPVEYNLKRITKADNNFAKKIDFKEIKFPVKVRDIRNIERNNSISFSVFGYWKNIQYMYQKNVLKKNMLIYY